ncbi:MAG: hypothetical protein DRH37_02405 [Deltaproteobacteria bacterium]|nr:MAG: hypothetical protein DRH37_02405 [Deltaproteobacteria bacterium]
MTPDKGQHKTEEKSTSVAVDFYQSCRGKSRTAQVPGAEGFSARHCIRDTTSCPSINEIRGTGEFPIRKCEFLRKAKEIKGLCGDVHAVRRTCLRACLSRPDGRQATHSQSNDPED